MAKPNETTMPDTPTTERALPPGRADRVPARSGGNGRPTKPAEMRREIERTRARMTSTLDALESRVAHERDALVDRATLKGFREKLSREPWRSVAIAFVAGYVVAAIRD